MANNRILTVDDEKGILEAYKDTLVPAAMSTPKTSSRTKVSGAEVAAAGPAGPALTATASNEYELHQAASGEAAIEIVKKELASGRSFAGGFFDVKMDGGIDGIQTIQEIWKLDPLMHCTIVTAYQDRSVQDINQLFGPRFKDQWDYLNKPFTRGEITQKARQMSAAWNRKREVEALQYQLVQSERLAAMGQVARGVGHEFGNILQRIVGKADLALSEKDLGKVKDALGVILQASDRATVIVRNLQSFAKGNSAKTILEITTVIADTLALVNHELMKNKVTVEDKSTKTGPVSGNPTELQQVFMNLVINAMHAMPSGGKLEIGCLEKDGQVVAWVKDSGTGISPDVLPRIFEYAFTTKGDKGSGLGLSISKQIIEGHKGTMGVQSVPGKGTVFTISIPKAGA